MNGSRPVHCLYITEHIKENKERERVYLHITLYFVQETRQTTQNVATSARGTECNGSRIGELTLIVLLCRFDMVAFVALADLAIRLKINLWCDSIQFYLLQIFFLMFLNCYVNCSCFYHICACKYMYLCKTRTKKLRIELDDLSHSLCFIRMNVAIY